MRFTNLYYYDDDDEDEDASFHSSENARLAAAKRSFQAIKSSATAKRSFQAIKSSLQMGLNAHTPSQCELTVLLYNLVG